MRVSMGDIYYAGSANCTSRGRAESHFWFFNTTADAHYLQYDLISFPAPLVQESDRIQDGQTLVRLPSRWSGVQRCSKVWQALRLSLD